MNSRALLIAIAAVAASGGCHSESPPTAHGGGPGPQGRINYGIARLSTAHCEREERCGDIGDDKTHPSRKSCETTMRRKLAEDLHFERCRSGIDDDELGECMNEVRAASCGAPIPELDAHSQCNVSQLCPD